MENNPRRYIVHSCLLAPTQRRQERGVSFSWVQGLVCLGTWADVCTIRCSLVANLGPLESIEPDWAGGSKNRIWFHTPPPRWPAQLPLCYFACRHICPSEESSRRKSMARSVTLFGPSVLPWGSVWSYHCVDGSDFTSENTQTAFTIWTFRSPRYSSIQCYL